MKQRLITMILMAVFISAVSIAKSSTDPKLYSEQQFLINSGQINYESSEDSDVLYYIQKGALSIYFLKDKISYVLSETGKFGPKTSRIDLIFNSDRTPRIYGSDGSLSAITYYTLDCPSGINPEQFKEVIYEDIYDNIDLKYYLSRSGSIKYNFIVNPEGNPVEISLNTTFSFVGFTISKYKNF